ncbi:unnamed protein product [Ostreobium quekettii]|uniref:Uncharacterized protein n=1 Tax=Ostreobium quekettii TaxID=121088 RepID=A0A8S1IXI6_9CHLO|nr:unnamed protein product [Ostreobium quekettii]
MPNIPCLWHWIELHVGQKRCASSTESRNGTVIVTQGHLRSLVASSGCAVNGDQRIATCAPRPWARRQRRAAISVGKGVLVATASVSMQSSDNSCFCRAKGCASTVG